MKIFKGLFLILSLAFVATAYTGSYFSSTATISIAAARPPMPGDIVITEFMADFEKSGNQDIEYIELYNSSNDRIDMNDCRFKDGGAGWDQDFPDVQIEPHQYMVFASSSDNTKNGGINTYIGRVAPTFGNSFNLNNAQEGIIVELNGQVIDSIFYDKNNGWPIARGVSTVLKNVYLDNSVSTNWALSTAEKFGPTINIGTPGKANVWN